MKIVDPEVGNVEREAHAVEREARALEREVGGFLVGELALQDLLIAARDVKSEDDDTPSTDAIWQNLLIVVQITKNRCEVLQQKHLDETDYRTQAATKLHAAVAKFQGEVKQQTAPPPADTQKAGKGRLAS